MKNSLGVDVPCKNVQYRNEKSFLHIFFVTLFKNYINSQFINKPTWDKVHINKMTEEFTNELLSRAENFSSLLLQHCGIKKQFRLHPIYNF